MADVERLIASVPEMAAPKRKAWLAQLRAQAGADETGDRARLIAALEESIGDQGRQVLERTGLLEWEKHDPRATQFRAFFEGSVVGRIFKPQTHTADRKEVYILEIEGEQLPDRFHHVADARRAGEEAFRRRRGQSD